MTLLQLVELSSDDTFKVHFDYADDDDDYDDDDDDDDDQSLMRYEQLFDESATGILFRKITNIV